MGALIARPSTARAHPILAQAAYQAAGLAQTTTTSFFCLPVLSGACHPYLSPEGMAIQFSIITQVCHTSLPNN